MDITVIGTQELLMKQIVDGLQLKHRPTILYHYIEPAIKHGIVTLLYPESPRHPRQKYKLTVKRPCPFARTECVNDTP